MRAGDPLTEIVMGIYGVDIHGIGGQVIFVHNPTRTYGAPDGAVGLTLNYAAPGGAYVTEGRTT
ncbi:MAG TPA: hypothetical protein VN748_02035 [Pseudonocardiaceae bacterium]|nr:hypothetical protein [Pseudonocardiaceae bacterium]